MCGGKVNSASIRPRILTGHMVMISLISVHGQSEHVWTKDLREHASQGLCRRTFEMTWNGLQGSALHSFTKGRASEKLMSRRVRSSDAKEKNCGTVGSVFTESVWLIERSCNRFSADFCLCSSEENCFHSTTKTDGHSGRALAAPCNYENSVPSRGRPRYNNII